jgi:hypothetical protein
MIPQLFENANTNRVGGTDQTRLAAAYHDNRCRQFEEFAFLGKLLSQFKTSTLTVGTEEALVGVEK